jgi:RNA recognition motif-containing protein
MAHNLYVGGFPWSTTKEQLEAFFTKAGKVKSAKVILDRETGRPKGFGFIEMSTDAEAEVALKTLNGADLGGRKIFVVAGRIQSEKKAFTRPSAPGAPSASAPARAPRPGEPGFVERRSGKDRRGAGTAGAGRREPAPPAAQAPAPSPAPDAAPLSRPLAPGAPGQWAKKPWVKKPFDPAKKWEKKPFDPTKKPWEKKPFDPAKKWVKKPFDPAKAGPKKSFGEKRWDKPKNPHAKPDVPFKKTAPPLRGKKWYPKSKDA